MSFRRDRIRVFLPAALWALCTIGALLITLPSVQPGQDFDGMNNLFQIPFSLPWILLPIGTDNHQFDAFLAAGMGFVNSGLILRRSLQRARRS